MYFITILHIARFPFAGQVWSNIALVAWSEAVSGGFCGIPYKVFFYNQGFVGQNFLPKSWILNWKWFCEWFCWWINLEIAWATLNKLFLKYKVKNKINIKQTENQKITQLNKKKMSMWCIFNEKSNIKIIQNNIWISFWAKMTNKNIKFPFKNLRS